MNSRTVCTGFHKLTCDEKGHIPLFEVLTKSRSPRWVRLSAAMVNTFQSGKPSVEGKSFLMMNNRVEDYGEDTTSRVKG